VDVSGPDTIFPSVFTTGELGTGIKEQALLLRTARGQVVLTGCAHPGIVEMVKAAKIQTGEDIYLVIGGFHLGGASESEVISIINSLKALGVKKAAPCHCSGQRTRELFEQHYGNEYIANGVGKVIVIE
jgi:7,8-dihydropterin-6-yl-methyl-4-(beta-D-ribofuranosyl)aminobenzene 5'-phosphate synthase